MSEPKKLFLDLHPDSEAVQEAVEAGLSRSPKQLPPKLFYDKRGSELFDQICTLEEYYPTRTESAILEDNIDEITERCGSSVLLIEYGSGSSNKTQFLLHSLPKVEAYIPIDISKGHLLEAQQRLEHLFPDLNVLPVCADYAQHIKLGLNRSPETHTVAFFPGSTIGNFEPEHALGFLERIHETIGIGGSLLIGVDLVKDIRILERAYNDSMGVTAAFNLNMIHHINTRLGTNINASGFCHRALYNSIENRIEMYLDATLDHQFSIGDTAYHIPRGESILTEYSHKYTLPAFEKMAERAGFRVDQVWTDRDNLFSLQFLTAH
ncbi:L-histidine N(alpha)-methyltransferase [bacterium]|nr:L-histidine N(alpha)-methyltransferase [bacterium]